MVGTIVPVVYRDKPMRRWLSAVSLYVIGGVLGGAGVGAVLGFLGDQLLGTAREYTSLLMLGVFGTSASLYALHELRLWHLPYPQIQRQVPSGWRYQFHPYWVALAYGIGLGTGVATYIATASVYIVFIGAFLSGDPLIGAGLLGGFGLTRTIYLVIMGSSVRTWRQSERLLEAMTKISNYVRLVNGLALALFGALALTGTSVLVLKAF